MRLRGGKLRARLLLVLYLLLILTAPWLTPVAFQSQDRAATLQPPTWESPLAPNSVRHWLGTDEFGRDQLSRLLIATTASSILAFAMATGALLLALLAGLAPSLFPACDGLCRGAGEVCRGLPWLFLLAAVRAALPLNAGVGEVIVALIGLFALAAWPLAAWSLHSAARDLLQRDFMHAARALGASRARLLRHHLWPNLRSLVATYFALLIAAAAGAEVSLGMVGLGVPQPFPTWGNMLFPLDNLTLATHAWWLYSPLLVVVPLLAVLTQFARHQNGTAAQAPVVTQA